MGWSIACCGEVPCLAVYDKLVVSATSPLVQIASRADDALRATISAVRGQCACKSGWSRYPNGREAVARPASRRRG